MATKTNALDFKTILASAAHDMKNSLSMLLSTLDEINTASACAICNHHPSIALLNYEAKRVNNDLVQLLALFRLEQEQYEASIDHQNVYDFLEDQLLNNHSIFEMYHIEPLLDCPAELTGFFDRELLAGVINNIINNTVRYSRSKLTITAGKEGDYLRISVEDDGSGYPPAMLVSDSFAPAKLNLSTGNTGLGLYFSSVVAKAHQNGGREGYIRISNDSRYDQGGCFSIYLP